MGSLTLRLSIGAAALLFASGAPAQVAPRPGWTDVASRDRAGNLVIISYLDVGPPGFRPIEFRDAEGRLINKLGKGAPMAPASSGGSQKPLRGDPIPELSDTSPVYLRDFPSGRADAGGRSDTNSELLNLVKRVNALTQQVKLLTNAVNAERR